MTTLFERIAPAGGTPRDVATLLNLIVEYLEALADGAGFAEGTAGGNLTTVTGVWQAVPVTITDANGFDVQNTTQIHALRNMLAGLFLADATATNLANNRTYDIGTRQNGDDGTIVSESFDTGTIGVATFTTFLVTDNIANDEYIEIVVRSDTNDTWDLEATFVFASVAGAKL